MNDQEKRIEALESEIQRLQGEAERVKEVCSIILYLVHGFKHLGNMEL